MTTLQIPDDHISDDHIRQAVEDTRQRKNLFGPFDTAEEAVASMLED